jgi:hypothetical protein
MKLTLDQLRVDSYSTQVSENELTEIKGGTTIQCWQLAAAVATAVAAWWYGGGSTSNSGATINVDGTTVIISSDGSYSLDSVTVNGVYGLTVY